MDAIPLARQRFDVHQTLYWFAMQQALVRSADMAAGEFTLTGRDLDIALDGEAMIAVQAADGSEAYTRRGDLKLTESGLLTTGDGLPVMGEGGPITLPSADSVKISNDGSIWIMPTGGDVNQPQRIDQLKLASPKASQVAKALDGTFREVSGGVLPTDPTASVTPSAVEGSNVNATQALVQMIEASRSWETQIKMINAAKEIDDSGTSLMKIPGA